MARIEFPGMFENQQSLHHIAKLEVIHKTAAIET
jgi:hypothetical protein